MKSTHQQSSLLVSQPALGGFSYSALLQDDDVNVGIEEACSSVILSDAGDALTVPGSQPESADASAGAGAGAGGVGTGNGNSTELVGAESTGRKVRMERRGHTKSRRGCYNCKRRRIKVPYEMKTRPRTVPDERRGPGSWR